MLSNVSWKTQRFLTTTIFRATVISRLNVVEITLPPLRLREDLTELAQHLLRFFAKQTGRNLTGFTPEAKTALAGHSWPGNLRELRNAVERAAILAAGPEIGLEDLPERIGRDSRMSSREIGGPFTLDQVEVEHIRRVLSKTSNLESAAKILGIDPSTLFRKRRKYEI